MQPQKKKKTHKVYRLCVICHNYVKTITFYFKIVWIVIHWCCGHCQSYIVFVTVTVWKVHVILHIVRFLSNILIVHFRTILASSGTVRYLHTAVFLGDLMIVFGGNTHNDSAISHGAKCYSPDFLAYDPGNPNFFSEVLLVVDLLIACVGSNS